MNTINELTTKVHEIAKTKGWWENPRSPLEIHMLIVSEVAEATEEARKGTPPIYQAAITTKPEGELVELADTVIRILDYCGYKGWDLEQAILLKMQFNQTRPHRHGGKVY